MMILVYVRNNIVQSVKRVNDLEHGFKLAQEQYLEEIGQRMDLYEGKVFANYYYVSANIPRQISDDEYATDRHTWSVEKVE